MSLIQNSKWGDCDRCSAKDTACKKRGKQMVCLHCCKVEDNQKATAKAIERNKIRGLGTYQREEGILDSIQELTIDLDRVISRYIRLRDMEADEKIRCYCCGKRLPYQKAHAMHFIPRSNMGTRFLLENLKSGCPECNVTKRGNMVAYEERLNKENPGMVEWLREQSLLVANVTREELKQLLIGFQQRLRMVENSKLNKNRFS